MLSKTFSAHAKPALALCYLLVCHVLSVSVESLNLLLRRLHIGNINISRRAKGVPDHPVPVLYPFVTVLSVGAGGRGCV